jgi:ATP synthase protein I
MNEREKNDPLREFGERLDKARAANQGPLSKAPDEGLSSSAALVMGWRVGIELILAVAAGAFLGWAVDKGLGTRPWGVIIGFFVGIIAGMWEVYRAMMSVNQSASTPPLARNQGGWSDDED